MHVRIRIPDLIWVTHKLGDMYTMDEKPCLWRITYYPLYGTWDNKKDMDGNTIKEQWIDFKEPRALIESPIVGGIDFREIPLRYLKRVTNNTSKSKKYGQSLKWTKKTNKNIKT